MNKTFGFRRKSLSIFFAIFVLMFAFQYAVARDIGGYKLDDTARVANQNLVLNGAGIRYKAIFKVYVGGLYLSEKKSTLADVTTLPTAKRMTILFMRDIDSEQFGNNFVHVLKQSLTMDERIKIIDQMVKLGDMFTKIPEFKKGDVLTCDWIPGSGTMIQLNEKKTMDLLPDVAFYNALLKIWLGDHVAQDALKQQLLGEMVNETVQARVR
ncbi:MAG TPA: chalcone isomerase family protein [Burkholderiaceae bacterium]|jgi:hypothetical protein|nr:chalcone isomerase family protein [Burkholderiaceae bacterium]